MSMRPPWAGAIGVRDRSARPGLQGLDELTGQGLLAALFGNQQPAGQIDGHGSAADDGKHGEDDPHDGDVDAEVAGDAGSDSRQQPVLDGAAQRLWPALASGLLVGGFWLRSSGCVHGSSVLPRARPGHREDPRSEPDATPITPRRRKEPARGRTVAPPGTRAVPGRAGTTTPPCSPDDGRAVGISAATVSAVGSGNPGAAGRCGASRRTAWPAGWRPAWRCGQALTSPSCGPLSYWPAS